MEGEEERVNKREEKMLHSCNSRTARMCAAGIYGKVMADSCPGNVDNMRKPESSGERKEKRNRERLSKV